MGDSQNGGALTTPGDIQMRGLWRSLLEKGYCKRYPSTGCRVYGLSTTRVERLDGLVPFVCKG